MADFKKIPYEKFLSTRGVAVHPHLNVADTKFGAPVFKTNLKLPAADAAPMVAKIDAYLDRLSKADSTILELLQADSATKLQAAIKAKKAKVSELPYIIETDDEGNETGFVIFKFKKNGSFKNKKGETVMTSLPMFDAKKQTVKSPVWGGSELKVAGFFMPWVSAKAEYGVKLAMDAVQVLLLRQGGGGNADAYGFGEEEGFEQGETAGAAPNTEAGDPGASSESDF